MVGRRQPALQIVEAQLILEGHQLIEDQAVLRQTLPLDRFALRLGDVAEEEAPQAFEVVASGAHCAAS